MTHKFLTASLRFSFDKEAAPLFRIKHTQHSVQITCNVAIGQRSALFHEGCFDNIIHCICLQSIKDMPVVQDGPPPGGFPSVRIARRIPSTGPGGFTLFAVSASVMAYGFYLVRA